jgi:transposase
MKLSAKDLIKLILSKEDMTQKELAYILTNKIGKKYTQDGLSRKLNRDTITYREVALITDILGYEIKIEHK